MQKASAEFKVGLFVIVVLAVLSFMTFRVGGLDWFEAEGYRIHVYFRNIAGLDENTKVKIAGVNAGVIANVELIGSMAKLTVKMYPDVVLFSDSLAAVKTTGLLGDKYLSIEPGVTDPVLKDGDTITNTTEVVDIGDAIRKLALISDNLNAIIGTDDSKESLRTAILALKDITSNLNKAISVNDKKLRGTLDNLNSMAKSIQDAVDRNAGSLEETLANLKEFSDTLQEEGPELVQNFKETSDSLKEISGKVERGEGTLGKLVQDEELYDSISNAAEGLSSTVAKIEQFRTFLTFQGEYLTEPAEGKGYFYLTLQPNPKTYYILGVVGDNTGSTTETTTEYTFSGTTTAYIVEEEKETEERKIEFTAMYGRRFYDTVVRVGLMENTFGAGIDQYFMNDRLKFTLDAWDFSGEQEDGGEAHVKIGADYFFYKRLFLSAGYDNIFNDDRAGVYVGGGARFEDEDFKYLLRNISVSPSSN